MGIPGSLGRYEVQGKIGVGGMAVVYEAMDPVIDRRVAIKVLRDDLAVDPAKMQELQRRFESEFRSAGSLSHPGIVTIHDVGHEGDTTYIAMEYVDGGALDDLIEREGPLSAQRVDAIIREAAAALDYAHGQGVVHRDVKPGNVMLTSAGHVKITDFGIAKLEDISMTRTGVAVGTPAYMSPEQVTASPVSGRSDQFALATIAYEMLTGARPFGGESATAIMYQIVHGEPAAASQLNADLPPSIDNILRRALAKEPEDRYETCAELAEKLGEALERVDSRVEDATMVLETPAGDGEPTDVGGADGTRPAEATRESRTDVLGWVRSLPVAARLGMAVGAVVLLAATLWMAGGGERGADPGAAPADADTPRESVAYRIVSDPAGARVELDGRALEERTPVRVTLPVDREHGLVVELPGYEPYEYSIASGDPYTGELRVEAIHVALRPAGERFVADAATPEAAEPADGGDEAPASRPPVEDPEADATEGGADDPRQEEPQAPDEGDGRASPEATETEEGAGPDPSGRESRAPGDGPDEAESPDEDADVAPPDGSDQVVPLTPEVRRPALLPESVALELEPDALEAFRAETRTLTLRVLVEDDGSVSDARFYGVEPEFTPSGMTAEEFADLVRRSAIGHWRFRPAMKYGYPVRVWFMVRVEVTGQPSSEQSRR